MRPLLFLGDVVGIGSIRTWHWATLSIAAPLFSAAICLAPTKLRADDLPPAKTAEVSAVPVPADVPPLPGPRDASYIINARNVALFHDLLLEPIASLIKDGRFSLKAVRSLDFPWQLSPEWETNTSSQLGRFGLDQNLNLELSIPSSDNNRVKPGYPFPPATINQEPDPIRKAAKILWDSTYAEAIQADAAYDVEFEWIGQQQVLRKASGTIFRRFFFEPTPDVTTQVSISPSAATDAVTPTDSAAESTTTTTVPPAPAGPVEFSAPGDVFMQEVLQFSEPPVVFGFSQVAKRFRGSAEDLLWIYSPVVGRSRHVMASNRSDPLLGGSLTLEDLMVFQSKIQSLDMKVVAEKVMLLPFPSVNLYRRQAEQVLTDQGSAADPSVAKTADRFESVPTIRGYHKRSDSSSAAVLWNYETGEAGRSAAWVPTTVTFVPRNVWILELSSKDPYYLAGRQIVVIDQESMLPFYKIVYERTGQFRKTVLGGWALASDEKGNIRTPFIAFVLAIEAKADRAMAMTTRLVRAFEPTPSKTREEFIKLLDIRNYKQDQKSGQTAPAEAPPEEEPAQPSGGF